MVDHAVAVSAGMLLEQVLSRQAGAVVLEADEPHYRRVFQQVLSALQGISARVEDAGLGIAYVALEGLETMYGGEERLVCALLTPFPSPCSHEPASAKASSPPWLPPAAGAAEGHQGAGRYHGLSLSPVHGHLPVPGEIISALRRFGLHTLGQVAAMDQALMIDQFGPEGGWIWNLANGRDDRPLMPLKHQETVTEQTSLPFSSTSLEMLLVADTLLRRAYARPVMRGRYARQAALECPVFGAAPWEKTVNFQEGVLTGVCNG